MLANPDLPACVNEARRIIEEMCARITVNDTCLCVDCLHDRLHRALLLVADDELIALAELQEYAEADPDKPAGPTWFEDRITDILTRLAAAPGFDALREMMEARDE